MKTSCSGKSLKWNLRCPKGTWEYINPYDKGHEDLEDPKLRSLKETGERPCIAIRQRVGNADRYELVCGTLQN